MARAGAHVTDPKSMPNEFNGSEGLWLEQNKRILLVEVTREGQMKKKTCRGVTLFDGLAFILKGGRPQLAGWNDSLITVNHLEITV